ncbi:helix-turn-helix domain-containing protein [Staphylococcus saprophyticus]|nr:helix-turn-helix domain-containing protein [Staphylococcus saprophyticus]
MEKFYTLKEIEDNLRISNRTLRRYIKSGKLKAVKIGGKYVVSESNYNDFISGK